MAQGGNAVVDRYDLVPGRLQRGPIQSSEFRIIFDHQDGDRLAGDARHGGQYRAIFPPKSSAVADYRI
jgi:hypothetical protein